MPEDIRKAFDTSPRSTFREEWTHSWQARTSITPDMKTALFNHLRNSDWMHLYETMPKGVRQHVEQHYKGAPPWIHTMEALAKSVSQSPASLGMTEDEASEYVQEYFKRLELLHGPNAFDELTTAVGPARKLLKERYGKARVGESGSGEDVSNPLAATK